MTPRSLTQEEVAEIEARLKKATPGPWTIAVTQHGDELRNALYQEVVLEGNRRLKKMAAFNHDDIADASFIAAARQDIPDLIHTLRQREAEIGRMREVVEAAKEVAPYGKHHCWFAPDGLCKTCSLRVPLAALNPPPREEGKS